MQLQFSATLTSLPRIVSTTTHYQLVTDSSNYAIGAALHQIIDEEPVPIGFNSKKLSEAHRKLSTFDRELTACYLAVLNFKHQIEGRHITLFTDHKPIVSTHLKQAQLKSVKQQGFLSLVTEYVADIQYIGGSQNIVADCLSKSANAVAIDICDLPALAAQQIDDHEIQR